jgi:acetoacetyl-CoA synthetase
VPEPLPLWTPPPARQDRSRMRRFLDETGHLTYDSAWGWSVEDAGAFWSAVATHFDLPLGGPAVLPDVAAVPGVAWFPDALLNYAEVMLRPAAERPRDAAVIAFSDTRPPEEVCWGELAGRVAGAAAWLKSTGVGRGDAVAGYLPNLPEALVAMLATASLGATWTCCAPEMGVAGTLDRLSQVAPKVLFAVDGYRYGSREVDRREEVAAIAAGLPSLERLVEVPYLRTGESCAALSACDWPAVVDFEQVLFDHPLYVLFSSGTTGKPKGIVHGHGGILVEHAKALGLHFDLGPGDRFFWYSTTGWMMWNFLVSGLLLGSTVVLYDGEPGRIWEVMEKAGVTCGGVGAAFLVSCAKSEVSPRVPALATLGSTGSPLPAAAAEWVYRCVGEDLMLASFSGGTDVCTGFVGTSPLHPVWAGEISCRCLGAKVEVFDDSGRPVVGEEGELVLTAPLPSMPVGILGDTDGSRYRATYFERFAPAEPGGRPVWAHGDRATLTERGTIVISGRSDGTLNRGGVRIGTAEIYEVVEGLPEVEDSLAVHLEDPAGGPGRLILFVVLAPGADLAAVREAIRSEVRSRLSPRYVPDEVDAVPAVPRTLSGKKLEVPVKRILSGMPVEEAVSLPAVADPASLEPFARRAAGNLSP